MNYFKFKLFEPTGKVSSGIIKLPYKEVLSAIAHLERDGSTTIYVRKLGSVSHFLLDLATFRFRKKVTRPFQAEFLSNVSMMLRSGTTLTTALEEAAKSSERPDFESDIMDMITNIESGSTFSQAAESYKYIFPETVVHLIRIGEETGKLDEMLADASEHLKRIQGIVSDTKQALMYPSFVFAALGAGLVFWFYYVVPKILTLFEEMDVELPAITVLMVHISSFVQSYFFHMILAIIIIFFLISGSRKSSRRFKKATDSLLLKLPLAKTIISASTLAFITEYFSLLLRAGMDILNSMTILKESVRNEVYRDKLGEVRENLEKGESISDSFKETLIFPNLVVRMINVGEFSGNLTDQLSFIAEDYRKKLAIIVATIGKTIEPLVLVIAGAIFAVIIGGLFLPVYDLVSNIGG